MQTQNESGPHALLTARERRGVTLTELANRLNMDPAQLHRIDNGKHDVRVGTLYRVARELEINDLAEKLKPYVKERAS